MILFVNTFITEAPVNPNWGYQKQLPRINLKSYSSFDIFKYSLASLAVAHDWSKVILKISLDDCYKDRQNELDQFIKDNFSQFNLILEWQRNEYQNDWKQSYELLDDNLIWYYCNHDHIFIDSSTDYLKKLTADIKDEQLCSVGFSHWPEVIRTVKQGLFPHPLNQQLQLDSYDINNNYVSVDSNNFDSIQIITKELYYRWWFEGEFNNIKLPRPDYFGIGLAEIKPVPIHKTIAPLKELCRHFDGYYHINPQITNNQCPAINIPDGFFENDIKIRYGYDDYKEGWVNINPKNEYYYAYNKSGTDYKFTLNDLPLVWKKRIKIIDSNPDIDEEEMLQYRLKSILETIYTSEYYSIDEEVKNKIINEYLKQYPEYQIYED
jgi:hypothetical protein